MKISFNQKKDGFTGIEIAIALVIIGVISSVIYIIFKDEFNKPKPADQTTTQTTKTTNPFPAKPTVSATGDWHGQFTVEAPVDCAGQGGGWQATLKDADGTISGIYSADGGFGGSVSGTVTADNAKFNVANASGVIAFNGNISGNTISGNFTGVSCSGQSSSDLTTGTFFGGRTVN